MYFGSGETLAVLFALFFPIAFADEIALKINWLPKCSIILATCSLALLLLLIYLGALWGFSQLYEFGWWEIFIHAVTPFVARAIATFIGSYV